MVSEIPDVYVRGWTQGIVCSTEGSQSLQQHCVCMEKRILFTHVVISFMNKYACKFAIKHLTLTLGE